MINMKVIHVKDIIKYLVGITLVLAIVMSLTRYFSTREANKNEENIISKINNEKDKIKNNLFIGCLDDTIPTIANKESTFLNGYGDDETIIQKILSMELGMTKTLISNNKESTKSSEGTDNDKEENIQEVKTDVNTEVVDNSQINTKFTNEYNGVKVKNESKYDLTEDILRPDIKLTNLKDILLFSTHTCESYTSSENYSYEATGTYRTTDLNFTVARVGGELKKYLDSYGYNVVHDQTYHDYPAYTGSYNRSLDTVNNDLIAKPETEMVFDVHRDAVGSNNNYAPTVKIGDEYASQIMFVIGTDGGGLTHAGWHDNLKFAVMIQEKANEMYPGLFKPIILRNSRYNQQVRKAANIIEVGATGNTLEQSLTSMKYLAKIISEVVK